MSLKRWNARRDANEGEIVSALEQAGALVLRLDAFDLLVLYRRQLFMMDAKGRLGRATLAQARLVTQGWPLRYVRTPEAALEAIGAL